MQYQDKMHTYIAQLDKNRSAEETSEGIDRYRAGIDGGSVFNNK